MRFSRVLLVLATTLCFCSISRADSTGAGGTYTITGSATLAGSVPTGCGSSPCVETLQFSVVMRSLDDGSDACSGPCYFSDVIGGGVTAAIGPISGPFMVDGGDPSSDEAYFDIYSPTFELDLLGFYSYVNALPVSGTHIDQAYVCTDPACLNFFDLQWPGGYYGTVGSFTTTVTQTPEPATLPLLLVGLFATMGTLGIWRSSRKLSLQNPANS